MEEPSFQTRDQMTDRVVTFRLYGEDGEYAGDAGDFWMDQHGYLDREIRYTGGPVFGAKVSFVALRDDLFLYGTGQHERLDVWGAAGDLRGVIRWESRARDIGVDDAEAWRRQRREEIDSGVEITPEVEPAIEAQTGAHLTVAELYPGHDQVVVAVDGSIWVEEYRRPRTKITLDGGCADRTPHRSPGTLRSSRLAARDWSARRETASMWNTCSSSRSDIRTDGELPDRSADGADWRGQAGVVPQCDRLRGARRPWAAGGSSLEMLDFDHPDLW